MAWGRKQTKRLSPEDLAQAWRRTLRAAVGEDWTAAETWLERIVESDSNDFDAYHALALDDEDPLLGLWEAGYD